MQAAPQRGVKQAAITQPEEGDPLGAKYGDPPMVQSTEQTGRVWTKVEDLTPALEGQTVRRGAGAAAALAACGDARAAARGKLGSAAARSGAARRGAAGQGWPDGELAGARTTQTPPPQVLVRARVHNTRGKGKSAFLVLRQRTATTQARRGTSSAAALRSVFAADRERPLPSALTGRAHATLGGPAPSRACRR